MKIAPDDFKAMAESTVLNFEQFSWIHWFTCFLSECFSIFEWIQWTIQWLNPKYSRCIWNCILSKYLTWISWSFKNNGLYNVNGCSIIQIICHVVIDCVYMCTNNAVFSNSQSKDLKCLHDTNRPLHSSLPAIFIILIIC